MSKQLDGRIMAEADKIIHELMASHFGRARRAKARCYASGI
ncbi:MAG: hypothetical protein ACSLE1_16790 [Sphingobium sp.]